MDENNYMSQFNSGKNEFLKGNVLQDWEQAGIRSYVAVMGVRGNLGVFFVLLALNAVFRLFIMGNASQQVQAAMVTELSGFIIVGVLAVITFFVPRWWMVLLTAIAIFPFALGVITGLMAVAFLCTLTTIKRANHELYLSNSEYSDLKLRFADIVSGKCPDEWPEIGKMGTIAFRVRFFDNAAVFISGKTPLNIISIGDAKQCVVETDKKGRHILKKWILNGKLKKVNIPLTEQGHSRLLKWLSQGTPTTQSATTTLDCPHCKSPVLVPENGEGKTEYPCPNCKRTFNIEYE